MRPRSTPEQWEEWQTLREHGWLIQQIANQYGVSRCQVQMHTHIDQNRISPNESQIRMIERLYASGETIEGISKKTHIAKGTCGTYIYKAISEGRLERRIESKYPPVDDCFTRKREETPVSKLRYKTWDEAKAADNCPNRDLRGLSLAQYNRLIEVNREYDKGNGFFRHKITNTEEGEPQDEEQMDAGS